jgi:hypothetical protein
MGWIAQSCRMNSTQRVAAAAEAGASDGERPLTVLVVGTDDWAIEQSAAALQAAGHEPLRCHDPGAPAFPCNALLPGRRCPLDIGVDAVVTSRARPVRAPTVSEMGVTCALHAGVPLVVTGISDRGPFNKLAARVVTEQGHVAAAVEDVSSQHESVIRLDEESP